MEIGLAYLPITVGVAGRRCPGPRGSGYALVLVGVVEVVARAEGLSCPGDDQDANFVSMSPTFGRAAVSSAPLPPVTVTTTTTRGQSAIRAIVSPRLEVAVAVFDLGARS